MSADTELAKADSTRRLFGENYGAVARFAELLRSEGELLGLIGPAEPDRLWDRHILNSAALVSLLPDSGTVADLGSGAGLPGIVIAIARPDLRFTLVEPMERRVAWLEEVALALALNNVSVVNARAEDLVGQKTFHAITARAVAPTGKLVKLAYPLLKPGGELLALKGRSVSVEVEKAAKVFKRFSLAQPEILETRATPESSPTTVLRVQLTR